jgi:hypothetical protein
MVAFDSARQLIFGFADARHQDVPTWNSDDPPISMTRQ